MRILYITHVNSMDGANRSLLQLLEELRTRHGVQPIVVCPSRGAQASLSFAQVCAERGIECYSLPLVQFKLKGNFSLLFRLRTAVALARWGLYLMYRLRHLHFDMVHSNSSVIDMGVYIALSRNVPHVWHLREFGEEDFRMVSVLGKRYEKWIFSKSTCAIAISKAIEKKFKNRFPNRIHLIYNGIPPQSEDLLAKHQERLTTFCMVGRLEPNKNQLEALQAVVFLKKQTQQSFKLLLVGKPSGEDYLQILRQFIAAHHLEENVEILSYTNDVPQLLQTCDVGLTLSTCEAFGRVTVEYMMQNLAVIVSDTGANPEIVTDGVTGCVYPLGRAEILAEKMLLLLNDRQHLLELASKGRQYALAHFTSVQNSDAIYALYQTLLKSS